MPKAVQTTQADVKEFSLSTAIQALPHIPAEELRKHLFDLKPFSTRDGAEILAAMIAGAIRQGKSLGSVSASPNTNAESITFDTIIERTKGNKNLACIDEGRLILGKQALDQIARLFERHYPEHLLLVRGAAEESGPKLNSPKATPLSAQAAKHLFVGSPFRNQAAESFLHKVVNAAIEKGCLIQDLKLEISGEEKGMLLGALRHSREFSDKIEQCLKFSEAKKPNGKKLVSIHSIEVGGALLAFLEGKLGHRRDYANLFS